MSRISANQCTLVGNKRLKTDSELRASFQLRKCTFVSSSGVENLTNVTNDIRFSRTTILRSAVVLCRLLDFARSDREFTRRDKSKRIVLLLQRQLIPPIRSTTSPLHFCGTKKIRFDFFRCFNPALSSRAEPGNCVFGICRKSVNFKCCSCR